MGFIISNLQMVKMNVTSTNYFFELVLINIQETIRELYI